MKSGDLIKLVSVNSPDYSRLMGWTTHSNSSVIFERLFTNHLFKKNMGKKSLHFLILEVVYVRFNYMLQEWQQINLDKCEQDVLAYKVFSVEESVVWENFYLAPRQIHYHTEYA